MKTYAFIVSILLLLACFGNYYQYQLSHSEGIDNSEKETRHETALKAARDSTKAAEARADLQIQAEKELRAKNDKEASERERVFESTVTRQRRDIAELKADRSAEGTVIDPKTAAIEAKYDSLITAQNAEIEALKVDGTAAKESFNREIKAITDKWTAELNENIAKDSVLTDLRQDLAKERKRGKIFRWAFYAVSLYAIIETLKD